MNLFFIPIWNAKIFDKRKFYKEKMIYVHVFDLIVMEGEPLINMINSLTDEETHFLTLTFHKVRSYIINDMTRPIQDALLFK